MDPAILPGAAGFHDERVVAVLPGEIRSWPSPVDVRTPTWPVREGREGRRNTYRCGWYG
jgi:hypothetical protein